MAISKAKPMRFTPRGLVDAFDATDKFPGACQQLGNLVFDQSNPEYVLPRPGVVTIENLAALGFANPTFISVQVVVGTRVYGMVATSRNAGHDEPFCIETASNSSIVITNVTSANTPLSPATTGDWSPPTMASVGVFVIVTHPGFDFTARWVGFIDLTNPTAPQWTAGGLATNTFVSGIPVVAVANLNNRAYYAQGNLLPYSDVLIPNVRTNATQTLTIGDTALITALAGLPVQTTSSGVLSALTVFKANQTWQVTGDTTTSDLALNFASLTVGTSSPRTVAQSPYGLYFLASGGPYVIDLLAGLHPLTHDLQTTDSDVMTPFQNAITPSRWAGAYNSSIYRVCGPTELLGNIQTNDYWFDEHKRRWTGPHSFVYDCASPIGTGFLLTSYLQPGILIQSQARASNTSVYTDLGLSYNVTLLSSTFPKTGDMMMKQVAESQIELGGVPVGAIYTITAQDESGVTLGAATITVAGTSPPIWGGGGTWGGGLTWGSTQNVAPQTYAVPWPAPLVFEKMQLLISTAASANVQIGTFYARYQATGYMTINQGA